MSQTEENLKKIRTAIDYMAENDNLEELTYMMGYGMAKLGELGCPIPPALFLVIKTLVDRWANEQPKKN